MLISDNEIGTSSTSEGTAAVLVAAGVIAGAGA